MVDLLLERGANVNARRRVRLRPAGGIGPGFSEVAPKFRDYRKSRVSSFIALIYIVHTYIAR